MSRSFGLRGALLAAAALLTVLLVLLAPGSTPYALAFLLCAGYIAMLTASAEEPLSADRFVRTGLILAIAIGVLAPALVGLVQASASVLEDLTVRQASSTRQSLLIVAAALFLLVASARRWPERFADWPFLALLTIIIASLKLSYVHLVSMEPSSDFLSMWSMTSQIADKGLSSVAQMSSEFYFRVYVERVLPYLLPLRLLFGPEPSSYAVANVLTGVLSSFLVYFLTRRWFGREAARIAFGVSLVAVETWLAAEIPTHDIPGALFTMLGLAIFVQACALFVRERYVAALVAGITLGVATVLIDLQRTTGSFLILSCGVLGTLWALLGNPGATGALSQRYFRRRALVAACVLLLAPVTAYKLIDWGLDEADLTVPPQAYDLWRELFIVSGSESWSDGSWAHFEYEYNLRYSSVPLDWDRLTAARLASDTHYTPLARLTGYLLKARRLFDLGSQTYFYLNGAELAGRGTIDPRQVGRIATVSRCFNIFFLAGLLLGCLKLLRRPHAPLVSIAPLFYLAVVSASLLFFALVQPRYLYQIWYIGAIYLGLGLAGRERPERRAGSVGEP